MSKALIDIPTVAAIDNRLKEINREWQALESLRHLAVSRERGQARQVRPTPIAAQRQSEGHDDA